MEEHAKQGAQKRQVGAAHRGSVARLTEHILNPGDTCQMKQLLQSLMDKLQILSRLDDNLIELRDKQLEEEVKRADLITERITFVLISLDDGLSPLQSPKIP